jgi:hypothetical protein
MTRHIRLTVFRAIAGLTLVVPAPTLRATLQSAVFRTHIQGGIRWTLGLE